MKNQLFLPIAILIFSLDTCLAQGFELPSDGKAVVYIVRPKKIAVLISFRLFHNDHFIGRVNAHKYVRYECEPGEHLFWASSENRDFITAELEKGKIYVLEAAPHMGGAVASVKLVPLDFNQPTKEKLKEKIDKLVKKKAPKSLSEEEQDQMNAKLKTYIQDSLVKYAKEKKDKHSHLASDMFYNR